MASKVGPRVSGTDGMDFIHRERIAPQYRTSATNKWRLKFVTILQLLLLALMLFRLSVGICVMLSIRPPSFIQRLRLPRAQMWEYWWLASVLPCIVALWSLRRNRLFFVQQYMLGTVVFGLAPVVYAILTNLDDLIDYWETKEAKVTFRGYPMVVLWNMFLTIALQVHGFGLYFAWQLAKAWKPREAKKKTT